MLLLVVLMLLVMLMVLVVPMTLMLVRQIFSVEYSLLLNFIKVGDVVSVENFPVEGETCRDASHPHQTVVKGILKRKYLSSDLKIYFIRTRPLSKVF